MSQYNSRIYIKVKDVADWHKLNDVDFTKYGFVNNPFKNQNELAFEIRGEWSCYEDELEEMADEITGCIPDCVLFGDTTNINVDPCAFIVYYLGEDVNCEEVEGELQWESQLDHPFHWFKKAEIELEKNEKEYLKSFGFKK